MTPEHDRKASRYQHQSWLVRRWRDRYLLLIPWKALRCWMYGGMRFGNCWSLAHGIIDGKRQWWFTSEECGFKLNEDDEFPPTEPPKGTR